MAISFGKVVFGILLMGIILTGFVKFGTDISSNSNLDSDTTVYLASINSSISGINDMTVNTTIVDGGDPDSYTAQYKEAKAYAKTAQGLLSVAEDTPDILIQTINIENDNNKWLLNYLKIAISLIILIVIIYMLFGRKF